MGIILIYRTKNILIPFVFIFVMMVYGDSLEYPFLQNNFRVLYDELIKEEVDTLDAFKQAYPQIPSFEWDRYEKIHQIGFALIQKEYAGNPACDKLETDCSIWSDKEYLAFIKQYTRCSLERNGIDPEKIKIYNHPADLVGGFPSFKNSFDLANEGPFDLGTRPYLFNDKIDDVTVLLVNAKPFESLKERIEKSVGIDQVATRVAASYEEKVVLLLS